MAEQPGTGGSRSYKIRGRSRQRPSAKPYARPKERKKTVLETVKDFLSPSWLVDLFQGTKETPVSEEEDEEEENEGTSVRMDEGSMFAASNRRIFPKPVVLPSKVRVGNGQLKFGDSSRASVQNYSSVRETRNDFKQSSSTIQVREATVVSSDESLSLIEEENHERLDDTRSQDSEQVDGKIEEQDRGSTSKPRVPALFSDQGTSRRPVSSLFGNTSTHITASTTASKSTFGTSSKSLLRSALAAGEKSKGPQPYTLSSKRPSFNMTAFGSPLPPKPSQFGVVRVNSSPFYRGTTSFGGASSQMTGFKRRRTNSPTTLSETILPERKQIKPMPVTGSGNSALSSQTAKRILEALEGMSSPLIDARKIPSPVFPPSDSPLSFSPSKRKRTSLSSKTVGSPRTLQAQFGAPPVEGLSAPQRAVVPTFHRATATSATSTSTATGFQFSTGSTTIPVYTKPAVPSFTPASLPVSLSPSSQGPKLGGGKMKSGRNTGHYTRNEEEEIEEVVNPIPEVIRAVPLSMPDGKALPSFSFGVKSQTSITTNSSSKFELTLTKSSDLTNNNFKFSAPAPKLSAVSPPPTECQDTTANMTFSFSQPCPVTRSSTTDDSQAIKSNSKSENPGKSSKSKSESLLATFAPSVDSWACAVCLVNNKDSDNMCVACTNARPAKKLQSTKSSSPNNDLLSKFAPQSGSWTCDTCLVSNKACDKKCVACQCAKPSVKSLVSSSRKAEDVSGDLRVKFALPAGSWSCDSCLLVNKATDTKCLACQSAKPGARTENKLSAPDLAKKFAPLPGSWSCDSCFIENKAELDKCVACQSAKPGAQITSIIKPAPVIPSDSNLAKKFAPLSDSWDCDTCLINNKGSVNKCISCQTPKPGANPSVFTLQTGASSAKSPFQFGAGSSKDDKPVQFGAASTRTETSGFMFGVSTESKESNSGVSFGSGGAGFTFVGTGGASSESKSSPFIFGGSVNSSSVSESKSGLQVDNKEVEKPKSIAAAASEGFLKVPGIPEPAKTGGINLGGSKSIADAAKAGMLKVPTAGEKKGDSSVPPNVNMFTSAPGTGPDNPLTAPGGMPLPLSSSTATIPPVDTVQPKASASTPFIFGGAASTSSTNPADASCRATATALQSAKPASLGFPPSDPASFTFGASNSTTAASSSASATAFSLGASGTAPTKSSVIPFNFTPSAGFGTLAPTSSAPLQGLIPPVTTSALPTASTAASSNNTQASPFAFGAGPVTFGGVTSTVRNTAPVAFGGGNINTTASNTTPVAVAPLGRTSVSSTTPNTAPGFGHPSTNTSAVKPFGFNVGTAVSTSAASNTDAVAKLPAFTSFNFAGNSQPAATNQPFTFGAGASSPGGDETMEADNNPVGQLGVFGGQSGSTAGAFGTSSSFGGASSNPSAAGFAFNQAPPAPGSSGGFNFGPQPSGGPSFAFGGTSSNPPAFGANSAQAPAGGTPSTGFGFNPGGNPGNVGLPGFNVGSGGAPAFTGGSADNSSVIAGRRIKRAVRRKKPAQ